MLECVINVSEGRRDSVIDAIGAAAGASLLDIHRDSHHNRSVFTLAGASVERNARSLASSALGSIDMREHSGVHPCIGAVDVVPFVPLAGSTIDEALEARLAFAHWLAETHGVPCFLYGPERSLPQIRKHAFIDTPADIGPQTAHETAGACAVGARPLLVAYNLWLCRSDLRQAREIAKAIRGDHVRSLGLAVGGDVQVSCNLISPETIGPAEIWDLVSTFGQIERAELVGLIPEAVVRKIPPGRFEQLDVSEDKTIEARINGPQ